MPFDPSKPFEVVEQPASTGFNPSQPFDVVISSPRTPAVGEGVLAGDSPYKDVMEAVPFSNAASEFRAGQRSGNQIFGNNIAGDVTGGILGYARGLATVLNPIGKVIGFVPKVAQAGGAASGGDLNATLQSLTGSMPVTSAAEINPINSGSGTLDTLINGLTGTYNEAIAKQPLSPLMFSRGALASQAEALRGLPGAVVETGRNLPGALSDVVAKSVETARNAPAALKSAAQRLRGRQIDQEQVALLERNVSDLQKKYESFKGEQTADSLKAAEDLQIALEELDAANEIKNLQTLTLEETLARLNQEHQSARAQQLAANSDLGSQLENLNAAASKVPTLASNLRKSLPTPEGPAEFGSGINKAVKSEIQEAKPSAQENYSAVREAADPNLKIETPGLEGVAKQILKDKKAGYSAALRGVLKSVLGESVERTPIDPLKQLSAEARSIYENLPDAQKQSFLDQAGIKLGESQPKTYSWNELEQRYHDLNGFIEDAKKNSPTDVMYFTRLKNALSNEMSKYAEASGTDVKALFDEANANYAANAERFGAIESLSKGSPESITAKIVGENKASTIEALKQVISPEKFQQVQAQFADRLLSPSADVPFDPVHFVKEFNKKGYSETLKAVFGEDGFNQLSQINELSKSAEQAKGVQSVLDEFNNKAQTAQDAYLKAKTAAEQNRLTDGVKSEAQKVVDAAKERIKEIEREQKGEKSTEKHERMQRDIDDAVKALEKAKTPEQISLAIRALYGVGSFAALAYAGAPVLGLAAGTMAAAFGRFVHRDLVKPVVKQVLKRR